MIIETCPKCGHDLQDITIATNPPIPKKWCMHCGWSWTGSVEEIVRRPFVPPEPETPNLDNLIHAIKCEEWNTNSCELCPYGYQKWDDSGDHGFWWHDDEKVLEDALFFLKKYKEQKTKC